MKRTKKLVALLLVAAILMMFSACGGDSPSSTEESSSSPSSVSSSASSSEAETSETAAEGDDWFAGRDFSEKQTITLASYQIEEGRDYNAGDDWVKEWTEQFNVEFEITPLTFENAAERLRIWINSDDMPDWCVWDYNNGEAANYADQGLVKMLPEGWKDQYPALAKAASDSPMGAMAEENFGGTHYLFRPIYSNNRPTEKLATHMSVFLRKDWGEAAGAETSSIMSLSEIMDYAYKVKEADPGNIGDSFAPIAIRSGNMGYLVQAYNTYSGVGGSPFYLGDDGQYHWGPADQSTLEALKLLNQAYIDGVIDPEFYTIQSPDDYGMFYTAGTSAVLVSEGIISNLADFDQHMEADLGVDFMTDVQVATAVDEEGNFHGYPLTNYWAVNIFSPHIDDAKLDRILAMMDYSCTDEGQLRIRLGIEDVDWGYDENGELVSYLDENDNLWDKYALMPVYVNMMVLSDDFQFQNPVYKQELRDLAKQIHIDHQENSTDESFPVEPDWNVELHSSQALNLASMTYSDEYAALIVQDGNIEENWNAWVEEKMPLVQPVLDELNENIA